MHVSLACQCGAVFEAESDEYEDSLLLLMHRFSNAHAVHGYMSHPHNTDVVVTDDYSGGQLGKFKTE